MDDIWASFWAVGLFYVDVGFLIPYDQQCLCKKTVYGGAVSEQTH